MPLDPGGEYYTVDLPGISDIISVPKLDDKARIKERLQLMKSARSPLPHVIDWMPSWIAHLDDARQWLDLAAPIAVPTMLAIPAIGEVGAAWFLSVREILVGMTSFMYLFTNGEAGKQKWFTEGQKLLSGRAGTAEVLEDYARRGPWLTALSAASKISYRLTGYGINVLPIWSAATDAFWGGIRALQGKRVIVRAPPSADPAVAAAHFLLNASMHVFMRDQISVDDHKMLLVAENTAAAQLLQDAGTVDLTRIPELSDLAPAYTAPWNPTTIEALHEEIGYSDGQDFAAGYPPEVQAGTYTDLATATWNARVGYEDYLRSILGNDPASGAYQALMNSTGEKGWSLLGGGRYPIKTNVPLPIVMIGHAIESDYWPPWVKERTFPWFGVQGSTQENRIQGAATPRAWKLEIPVTKVDALTVRSWADLMAEMHRVHFQDPLTGLPGALIAAGAIWGAFSTVTQFPGQPGFTVAQWRERLGIQRFYSYTLREQLGLKVTT